MKLSEDRLRGIFWGGLTGGLGSCLPVLAMANCICCLWAWIAGVIAVALVRGRVRLEEGDAPKLGALAGAFAGLVSSTGQIFYRFLSGATLEGTIGSLRDFLPDTFPEQSVGMLEDMAASGVTMVIFYILSTVFLMAIFSLFGALGGLLYMRLTRSAPPTETEAGAGAAPESD